MSFVRTLTAVACLATCPPAQASQIVPLDLETLAPRSELIVVGVVSAVSDSDAVSDTVSVRVVSTLKGTSEAKSFSLRLRNKGVKDFDPKLAVGDQGVYFLKTIKDGRAELTYWGSVAVVPKNGNFSVPAKPDDAAAKKPVPIPAGLDVVNRLREAVKRGTPAEKEAALDMIRALKPLALIPEVIDAIEDPTALPDHVTPDCKTGWGFVGHQAASVLAELARAIDGIEVGMKPGQRPYYLYSFHDDLEAGVKMQKAGRLAEVRKNWARWWDATRK